MNTIDLTDPKSYDFWTDEQVRFSDTDLVGHVNNVAHVALVETGRIAFLHHLFESLGLEFNRIGFARLEIDFRKELHYPKRLKVGACLVTPGRTSFVVGVGVFADGECITTTRNIMVHFDADQRSAPLPPELRAKFPAEF